MPSSKQHWETVYKGKTSRDLSWYQQTPRLSLELISRCGLANHDPILDIGGGASTLAYHLLHAGYGDINVLDLSRHSLELAKAHLGTEAERVNWLQQDVTAFTPQRQYTLWHDRAAFHFAVDEHDRRCYLKSLDNALITGGFAIIAAFSVNGPDRCSGLPVIQYDAQRLTRELGDSFQLIEQLDEVHETPAGIKQSFSYFRFVKKKSSRPIP